MNVLVLGGTYFIGRVLVELLLLGKHKVSTLNRGTRKVAHDSVSLVVADRHNYSEVKNGLKGKNFDAVIDLSGYNRDDVKIVLDSLKDRVSQYVFCSSIAVCSQPPTSWPITEDHQKCLTIEENEYGYNKLFAEDYLFQYSQRSNLYVSVVRPVYVYGPYDYSDRIHYFFSRILEGQPVIISGNGENIIQFGYVYDLCKAIIALLGNKDAYGQAFNISGREFVTVKQLIDLVSSTLGMKADIKFGGESSVGSSEISSLTNSHRLADIEKAQRMLGIIPTTSLIEGLKKTYEWWLTNRR